MDLLDDRLRLRPWHEDDAAELAVAVAESLDTVGRSLPWCHPDYGIDDANQWIARCRSGCASETHFAFAVLDRNSGGLVGGAGLNQRNGLHRSANLGYWVRQSRQRQGLGASAARLVASFGFECLGLIRIEVVVLPDNRASRRTAENAGAKYEGMARQRIWAREQAHDAALYALIPGDLS